MSKPSRLDMRGYAKWEVWHWKDDMGIISWADCWPMQAHQKASEGQGRTCTLAMENYIKVSWELVAWQVPWAAGLGCQHINVVCTLQVDAFDTSTQVVGFDMPCRSFRHSGLLLGVVLLTQPHKGSQRKSLRALAVR